MKIAVVGAGFVGLVTGACFAGRGHQATCVESDPRRLGLIQNGEPPFFEPGLAELLRAGLESGRFCATADLNAAVAEADLIFIAVGTPDVDERIDLRQIEAACRMVGDAMRKDPRYRVVVVKSTVVPGTTGGVVRQVLEKASGQTAGPDFGLAMNPEFLRQGFAVDDFDHSDRVVVGALDSRSGAAVMAAYADFDCPKLETSLPNAEMAKYTSNAFLAALISFSNEIAAICEHTPDADADFVMDALSHDRRLSPLVDGRRVRPEILGYLRAGSGFGGSCLPKDVNAIRQLARDVGAEPRLLDAVVAINKARPARLIELAEGAVGALSGQRVAVLGLTFKAGTDDLRDSPALRLVADLLERGALVQAFDPLIKAGARGIDPRIEIAADVDGALENADIAFLITAWPQFAQYDWARAPALMARAVLVDGRNGLRGVALPEGLAYLPIGRAAPSA